MQRPQSNSLATKAPTVAAQWSYEKDNGTADSVVAQRSQVFRWLCDAYGHKWTVSIDARVNNNSGCLQCAQLESTKHTKQPTLAECRDSQVTALLTPWDHEHNAADNNYPHNTTLKSHKQIHWPCIKCPAGQKHSWSALTYSHQRDRLSILCWPGHLQM